MMPTRPNWINWASWALRTLGRGLRGLAIACLCALAVLGLVIALLWDVDHYAARDRFENFKAAWFGSWPQTFRFKNETRVYGCEWELTTAGIRICNLEPKKPEKEDGNVDGK